MDAFYDIYQTIRKYYPIGIPTERYEYINDPGVAQLRNIRSEKIDDAASTNQWKALLTSLKEKLPKKYRVSSNNNPLDVSYNGMVLVQKEKCSMGVFVRELCFHISVLGPFFTLYGKDSAGINASDSVTSLGFFSPIIRVSPESKYEPLFPIVIQAIRQHYPDYQGVTFGYLEQTIKGLHSESSLSDNMTLFEALFTSPPSNYMVRGNFRYQIQE